MNRLASTALAVTLALATGAAGAQTYGGYGSTSPYDNQNRYGNQAADGSQVEYARVLRVDPVLNRGTASNSQSGPRCYDNQYAAGDVYEERTYRGYGQGGYDDRYGGRGYNPPGNSIGRTTAGVLGGVVGAVLGSKIGGGSGRYVTGALGSMMGGMAGQAVYDQTVRSRMPQRQATIRVCDPVPVDEPYAGNYGRDDYGNVQQYDVTYEYAGRQYTTRTNHHPGERIRVRVDVRPDTGGR